MPKTKHGLTDKQERFCQEYVIDLNGTQAAIRAGYSENTAESQASRLLTKAKVVAYIEQLNAKMSERLEISAERVLKELARIGFSDLRKCLTSEGHLVDPHDWDDDTAAAIASLEVVTSSRAGEGDSREVERTHKIKAWDKGAALERLGRHLGIFQPDAATPNVHVHIHDGAKSF